MKHLYLNKKELLEHLLYNYNNYKYKFEFEYNSKMLHTNVICNNKEHSIILTTCIDHKDAEQVVLKYHELLKKKKRIDMIDKLLE